MARDRDYWLVGRSVIEEWIQRGERDIGNASHVPNNEEEMSDVATSDIQSKAKVCY